MKRIIVASLLASSSTILFAEGSPWLSTPGETSVQLSFVDQQADEFWFADSKRDVPGGGDLSQSTTWLSVNYGISDNIALDLRTGYSESEVSVANDKDGITDSTIGLTWRFHDELLSEDSLPSAAIRIAATAEGDYDTGSINAIGDGASGAEVSLIIGKALTYNFAIAGDIGYRYRGSNVPNEAFINLSTYYVFSDKFNASLNYQNIDARNGLDIGGPGFSPIRFPEVEEDIESVLLNFSYSITPMFTASLGYGEVIDGRNTSQNEVITTSIGLSF